MLKLAVVVSSMIDTRDHTMAAMAVAIDEPIQCDSFLVFVNAPRNSTRVCMYLRPRNIVMSVITSCFSTGSITPLQEPLRS